MKLKIPNLDFIMYLSKSNVQRVTFLCFQFQMANAKFALSREALEEIISELRCYSCKSVPASYGQRRYVYVCVKVGHSLCENCKDKCACGSKVTKAPSKAISNLLKSLPNYCRFFHRGCREMLPMEEVEKHEKCCVFRVVICPTYYCEELISFHLFEQHFNSRKHPPGDIITAPRKSENSDTFLIYPKIKTCNIDQAGFATRKLSKSQNETFFVNGFTLKGTLHLWVQYYGSSEEAKNYEFSMSSKTKTSKMNTHYGPVYSIDEDKKAIWNKGETFAMSTRFMLGMIEKDGEFAIEVEIKCLKDKSKNPESGLYNVSE